MVVEHFGAVLGAAADLLCSGQRLCLPIPEPSIQYVGHVEQDADVPETILVTSTLR